MRPTEWAGSGHTVRGSWLRVRSGRLAACRAGAAANSDASPDADDVLVAWSWAGGRPPVVGVQQRAVLEPVQEQLLVRDVDETGELAGDVGDSGVGAGLDGDRVGVERTLGRQSDRDRPARRALGERQLGG